jgi:hypothetical protein
MNKTLIFLDIVSILILISTTSFKLFFETKSEKEYNLVTYKKVIPLYKMFWYNLRSEIIPAVLLIIALSVVIAGILTSVSWIFSCFRINFNFNAPFVFMLSLITISCRSLKSMCREVKEQTHRYRFKNGEKEYYCGKNDSAWKFILMFLKNYAL